MEYIRQTLHNMKNDHVFIKKQAWKWLVLQAVSIAPLLTYLLFHLLFLSNAIRVPNRLVQQFFEHPAVAIVMVVSLYVFVMFGFSALGHVIERQKYQSSYRSFLKRKGKPIAVLTLLFFIPLLLIVLPLVRFFVHPTLSEALHIPFFFEQMLTTPLIIIYIVYVLSFVVVCSRSFFTLEELVLNDFELGRAWQESWERTGKYPLRYALMALNVFLIVCFIMLVSTTVLFSSIAMIEQLAHRALPVVASVLLTVAQFIIGVANIFFLYLWSTTFSFEVELSPSSFEEKHPIPIMKISILFFVFIFINTIILSTTLYQPVTQIIAHRGASNEALENTIESMQEAKKRGADYVELDIQETKDGQFVVYHDETLKRLGQNERPLYTMTAEELVGYPIESKKFKGEIPSFSSFIEEAKRLNVRLLIELKIHGHESEKFLENYVSLLYTYDIAHQSMTQSMDLDKMKALRELDGTIETSDLISEEQKTLPSTDATYLSLKKVSVDAALIEEAAKRNQRIFVWTIKKEKNLKKYMDDRVAGIITNEVKEALDIRKAYENERTFVDRLHWLWRNGQKER